MQDDTVTDPWTEVTPGLGFASVYWVRGSTKPGLDGRHNEVTDPPTSGWSTTYVLYDPLDEGVVTLFNPYSFKAHKVSRQSAEFATLKPSKHDSVEWAAQVPKDAPMYATSVHWHVQSMKAKWRDYQRGSEPRDFDVAAEVLKLLGGPEMDKRKEGRKAIAAAGKAVAAALAKPVKRKGRKGEVLAWFVEAGLRGNLNKLCEALGIDRKNVLSQLYLLKKDHGIGYSISGDEVDVTLPEGCDDPFAA